MEWPYFQNGLNIEMVFEWNVTVDVGKKNIMWTSLILLEHLSVHDNPYIHVYNFETIYIYIYTFV